MQSRRGGPEDNLSNSNQSLDSNGTRVHHVPIFVESRGNTLDGRGTRESLSHGNHDEQPRYSSYNQSTSQPNFEDPQRSNSAFSQSCQSPPSFFTESTSNRGGYPSAFDSSRFLDRSETSSPEFSPNYTTYREPRIFAKDPYMGIFSPGKSQRYDYAGQPGSHQTQNDFARKTEGGFGNPRATEPIHRMKNRLVKNSRSPNQSEQDTPKSTVIHVPSPLSESRDNVTIVPISGKKADSPDDGPPKIIPLYSPEPTEPQSPPLSTTPIPLPPPPSLCGATESKESISTLSAIPSCPIPQEKESTIEPVPDEVVSIAKPDTPIPMPPPVFVSTQEQSLSGHDSNKPELDSNKHKQNYYDNGESAQLDAIKKVEAEVKGLVTEIAKTKDMAFRDKRYRYLDEMLTRCMLRLDKIDCGPNEMLRQARKTAIRSVNQAINQLESTTDGNPDK